MYIFESFLLFNENKQHIKLNLTISRKIGVLKCTHKNDAFRWVFSETQITSENICVYFANQFFFNL